MAVLLINTPNFIFLEVPSKKPDPKEPSNRSNLFTRTTVDRPLPKGDTNFYYALNLIRIRIGKNPSRSLASNRRLEMIASNLRKKISSLSHSLLGDFISASVQQVRLVCESEGFEISPEIKTVSEKRSFNFDDYLKTKTILLDLLYNKLFLMERATWNPSQNIENLIECVNKAGPMIVKGMLGIHFFGSRATISEKIESHIIYQFNEETHITRAISHEIVIVGAKILDDGRNIVYFKDPKDGGKDTYAISYELFSKQAMDFNSSHSIPSPLISESSVFGWQCPI
jgi:hypothetical protein